jgi:archaeal type IV pilus assembly protein PilA
MKRKLWYSKKGISTIIATIIIVSVSIVMAIAAAYWAMGIGQAMQQFERVEFTSIYSDPQQNFNGTIRQPDGNYFNGTAFTVYLTLKNTGSAAATINNIFLNGRPYRTGYANVSEIGLIDQTLTVGGYTDNARIFLPYNGPGIDNVWGHGNAVEVVIQTAAGRSYSKTVVLP